MIGDGGPAFALGDHLPGREGACLRLAAMCRALAAVVGGMGATSEHDARAAVAEACTAAMATETPHATALVPATARR